jgi:three-Cys-motif partner protein
MFMSHEFGGIWTQKKVAVLREYLRFYVTALKQQPFTLHYADAFAGTGQYTPSKQANQQELIDQEDFSGSVTAALELEPGFDEYHFNDLSEDHVAELKKIAAGFAGKKINITVSDANAFVPEFCNGLTQSDRAVLLLDPYSTQLDWTSLDCVSKSQKVDLWLLFPISVILRMTPTDGDRIRPEWKHTLDRLLGDNGWESSLYKPINTPVTADLFSDPILEHTKRINVEELKQWVTNRLRQLFPYVARPVLLENNGSPLFLFYFAVSNREERAWGLAQRAATHIINKFDER